MLARMLTLQRLTLHLANASAGASAWIAYRANVTGGNTTITVTLSASNYMSIWVAEFSGVAKTSPLDLDAAHSAATFTTTLNDPSIVTNYNGDLVIGVASPQNSISNANAPWSGTADTQSGD